MSERAKIAAKTPDAKRESSVAKTQKPDFSQSTSLPIDHIMFLQRTIGNQAVQRLLKGQGSGVKGQVPAPAGCKQESGLGIQAKLKIGQPNDVYEQEADRIAEQVMRIPDTIMSPEYVAAGREKKGTEKLETKKIVGKNKSDGQAMWIQRQAESSSKQKAAQVPQWEQLPLLAQVEFSSKGYDKSWFDTRSSNNSIRLTVLNLYVKLRGIQGNNLWNFVGREVDSKTGALQFNSSDINGLKATLKGRDDFTSPEDSPEEWSSREKRASGSLHFKHFRGWPKEKVQAHIDQAGLLLRSPWWWLTLGIVPLVQMGRHGVEYLFDHDDFTDVFGIRNILLNQGWWAEPLVGVSTTVQRKTLPGVGTLDNDSSLNIEKLKGHGQPLPMPVRAFFEPSFGYDFSQVRVHTDSNAIQMSKELNAQAFTVGQNIVFGEGRYVPETDSGQRLLAHELTHVVQQNRSELSSGVTTVNNGSKARGDMIQCAYYTKNELEQYLSFLKTEKRIEDKSDSDDKALAVIHWWEAGRFKLNKKIKSLLILEMLSGFTGDDEESAILELLERSDNAELNYIFSTGGVTVDDLESNFHGDEFKWLKNFFERRFEGGWEKASRGQLKPKGAPLPKRWLLYAVFPERAEGEVEETTKIELRKYISKIAVKFTSVRDISSVIWTFAEDETKKSFPGLKNKEDFQFDIGSAKATYNNGTEDSFDVSGGALGSAGYKTHRTGTEYLKIHSKGGASYVNQNRDPMPHASFFYKGQAFHGCGSRNWFKDLFAPAICLDVPSHGCIHVENSKMEEISPFIVVDKTKVNVR